MSLADHFEYLDLDAIDASDLVISSLDAPRVRNHTPPASLNPRADLLRAVGRSQPPPPPQVGGRRRKGDVQRSRELERVLALPLREPYTDRDRAAVQTILQLRTAPEPRMRLWPQQCAGLLAAADLANVSPDPLTGRRPGLLASITIGGGKTLLGALLGTIWDCKRPMILTDASLVDQTRRLIAQYRRHFKIPSVLQVLSYSTLSTAGREDVLSAYAPDAIICDEASNLKNAASARGRRLRRYLKSHPDTRLALMTGTAIRKSYRDLATLAALALWHWSPAPRDYPTQVEWSEALDQDAIRGPGALALLADRPGYVSTTVDPDEVRAAVARRLAVSPGVVVAGDAEVDVPLVVRVVETPTCPDIQAALADLKATWCRPDGEELALATEMAEVRKQISLGGYYAWVTEPDREWLLLRSAWRRAAREWIHGHPGSAELKVDSELALERAVVRGDIGDAEVLAAFEAWVAVRGRAKEPPKEWRWISTAIVEWLAEHLLAGAPAACFVRRIGFAETLAEISGLHHFASGDPPSGVSGDRSIVLSLDAYKKGQNMQMYSRALVVDPSPAAADWQQLIGRLHRPGQEAEQVTYEVLDIFRGDLMRAVEEAGWAASIQGMSQKLLTCTLEGV